jgi:hypothetical protein
MTIYADSGPEKVPSRMGNRVLISIVSLLALMICAFIFADGNWNFVSMFPTIRETLPSPDIRSTVAPAPSNSTLSKSTTPVLTP